MNKTTGMRILLFTTACFIFITSGRGQVSIIEGKELLSTIYKRNHLSFTAGVHLAQKAKTTKETGNYPIGSQTQGGFEAGFNYHINFKNKPYSIIIGIHGVASARNFTLFIPKEDFDPPQQYDYMDNSALTRAFDMHFTLPILFERRWHSYKQNHWSLNGGPVLGYFPDDISEGWGGGIMTPGGYAEVINLELEVTSDLKPWLGFSVNGGHSWLLRNYNMFRADFHFHYTSFNITKGVYQVTVPGQDVTTGTYKGRLSNIGISLNYIFTGANKTLRKEYEKRLRAPKG